MKNPLSKSSMFATPESVEALTEYVALFNGDEGVAATVCSQMAWNLASALIDKEIAKENEQ